MWNFSLIETFNLFCKRKSINNNNNFSKNT